MKNYEIEFTGKTTGNVDWDSMYNWTLQEWLEEMEENDDIQVSYKGTLESILHELSTMRNVKYGPADFEKDLIDKKDYLNKVYEIVFSVYDYGIEYELI